MINNEEWLWKSLPVQTLSGSGTCLECWSQSQLFNNVGSQMMWGTKRMITGIRDFISHFYSTSGVRSVTLWPKHACRKVAKQLQNNCKTTSSSDDTIVDDIITWDREREISLSVSLSHWTVNNCHRRTCTSNTSRISCQWLFRLTFASQSSSRILDWILSLYVDYWTGSRVYIYSLDWI